MAQPLAPPQHVGHSLRCAVLSKRLWRDGGRRHALGHLLLLRGPIRLRVWARGSTWQWQKEHAQPPVHAGGSGKEHRLPAPVQLSTTSQLGAAARAGQRPCQQPAPKPLLHPAPCSTPTHLGLARLPHAVPLLPLLPAARVRRRQRRLPAVLQRVVHHKRAGGVLPRGRLGRRQRRPLLWGEGRVRRRRPEVLAALQIGVNVVDAALDAGHKLVSGFGRAGPLQPDGAAGGRGHWGWWSREHLPAVGRLHSQRVLLGPVPRKTPQLGRVAAAQWRCAAGRARPQGRAGAHVIIRHQLRQLPPFLYDAGNPLHLLLCRRRRRQQGGLSGRRRQWQAQQEAGGSRGSGRTRHACRLQRRGAKM